MKEQLYCKSGGCTAKLGAGVLSRVLSNLEKKEDPDLLVGFDSHDDGAVYRLNEEQAIVTTLDFFPPLVKDPYTFGAIAAANAMSDVYAMGGSVLCALNIVCFPQSMDLNILGKIMEGGNDKVIEAGGTLAGGHSIADDDVKYGLSVTGVVHPDRIMKNNTPNPGDTLYLTKPLGTGVVLTADRIGKADSKAVQEAVDSMLRLNKGASEAAVSSHASAMSDVTGFGLLVHLSEMLDGKVSAHISMEDIPVFDKVREYVDEFYITAAGQRNRNYIQSKVRFEHPDYTAEEILYDPQTSGGLLIAVPEQNRLQFETNMKKNIQPFWKIGTIVPKEAHWIVVKGALKNE